MNKDRFEGAEMTVYTQSGGQFSLELSQMQVFVVMKLLGISFNRSGSYSCYSDEALKGFFNFKGNPLRLEPKE